MGLRGRFFLFCVFICSLQDHLKAEPFWRSPAALDAAARRLGHLNGSHARWSSVGNLPIDQDRKSLEFNFLMNALVDLGISRYGYSLGKAMALREFRFLHLEDQFLQKLGRYPLDVFVDDNLGRPVQRGSLVRSQKNGVTLITDPLGRTSKSLKHYVAKVRTEAIDDLDHAVDLSLKYPQMKGWQEDDFLARRKWATVLDREFFRSLCRRARARNPNFQFNVTLYCHTSRSTELDAEREAYSSFMSSIRKYKAEDPAREIEAFLEYASDREIHSCISGVTLWHSGSGSAIGAPRPWEDIDTKNVSTCVDRLRTNRKPIALGIYVSGYSSLGLGDSVHNLDEALQIPVDEYRLFQTPLPPYPIGSEESATNGKLFRILSKIRN